MRAPVLTLALDVRPRRAEGPTRWLRRSAKVAVILISLACCSSMLAQENFLVATQDGTLSLYDLTSYSPLESFQSGPFTYTIVAGPNNRLAFSAGGAGYGAAVDTTIGRGITSLSGVRAPSSTMGGGGKYYLAADYSYVLDVVDSATLQVVRKIDLSSVIPRLQNPGAIVAANNKAYIFPRSQNARAPKVAVVDLSTFQLSSIAMPAGTFCRRCASRTPDGSMVVAIERENSDSKIHVLLINTTTNTVVKDFPQSTNYSPQVFVVTRSTDPTKLYGYAGVGGGNVVAVDLQPNSQTYGQILATTTKVTLPNFSPNELVTNSDGSKLIAAGTPSVQPPVPNTYVVDTAKMLSDPAHAVLAQVIVNGGITANSVCTAFFVTAPPNSAPTVSGVSGDITNDKDNDITITGGNFQPGAMVRIGSLPPLLANFLGNNMLSLTVPKGVPAGKAQDIIVTNPLTNFPPNQQNQSGLLAGKFNILPTPKFQPTTQFATANQSSLYVYDLKQQTMLNVPTGAPGDIPLTPSFNVDGKYLYLDMEQGYSGQFYVLPVNLSTNTAGSPITLPSNTYYVGQTRSLAAGRDPQTNSPVQYVLWTDNTDLHLGRIDSDPGSNTFNTIVKTFDAGLNGSYPSSYTITLSPDSKFAYVWYYTSNYYLGIFNLGTGGFTNIRYDALRVAGYQYQIGITPDGKSLLLSNLRGNKTSIKLFDISNPLSPKPLTEITPIPISGRGFPFVNNYQVLGDKLYAIDLNGAVVVFNFDRSKGDFRQRGYVSAPYSNPSFSGYAFSADGSYIYIVDYFGDSILAGDVSKLLTGGEASVTSIRSPFVPNLIDVSPVAPPSRQRTSQRDIQSPLRRTNTVPRGIASE